MGKKIRIYLQAKSRGEKFIIKYIVNLLIITAVKLLEVFSFVFICQ